MLLFPPQVEEAVAQAQVLGEFLVARGIVDGAYYKEANDRFYADYQAGRLDIQAYQTFVMQVLAEHPLDRLRGWHRDFMREVIEPIVLPKAVALVEAHRRAGDRLLIITATNDFITGPIAERFGIQDAIWRGAYYTPGGVRGGGYGHYDHVHITTTGGGYPDGDEVYYR